MLKLEVFFQGEFGGVKYLVKEVGVLFVGIGQQEVRDGF